MVTEMTGAGKLSKESQEGPNFSRQNHLDASSLHPMCHRASHGLNVLTSPASSEAQHSLQSNNLNESPFNICICFKGNC